MPDDFDVEPRDLPMEERDWRDFANEPDRLETYVATERKHN